MDVLGEGMWEEMKETTMIQTKYASEFSDSDSQEDELDRLVVRYVGGVSQSTFQLQVLTLRQSDV